MPKKCVIISGGEFCPIEAPDPEAFVIACDRGYEYALRCGIKPDLLISDFDSYSGPIDPAVPVDRFRSEKDDTDTMIALRWAVERGYEEAELLCALGGRLDHTLANIQSAVFAAVRGVNTVIKDARTELRVLTRGKLILKRREHWVLSLFSLSDECRGVSVRGAEYPLDRALLTNRFPLGVSNEWATEEAEIELESGLLLVVQAKC